ncbi:MAG: thiamine phosphate synthase [Pseudanabaenaceae cyanobacterium]
MADITIHRILDANLDRAREGIRVLEEWCRFGLEDVILAEKCKNLRQTIAQWHHPEFRAARNTPNDVGTNLSHPQEMTRLDVQAVLQANCCRVQEALRVLEEYGKLTEPALAEAMKAVRYEVYTLEHQLQELGAKHYSVTNGVPNDTPQVLPAAVLAPTVLSTAGGVNSREVNSLSDLRQKRLAQLDQARLYLVTMFVPSLVEIVEKALQGGTQIVQYRQKDGDDSLRLAQAQQLCDLCHRYGALFLVNDRVDLALAVGADGVHVGQTDLPVAVVRRLLGPDAIVGQSTTNPEELTKALAANVDYIGTGPVYATPTKPGKAAAGFAYIRYVQEYMTQLDPDQRVPWFAIGGINPQNAVDVLEAGAKRLAIVRALMQCDAPQDVAQQIWQTLQQHPLN